MLDVIHTNVPNVKNLGFNGRLVGFIVCDDPEVMELLCNALKLPATYSAPGRWPDPFGVLEKKVAVGPAVLASKVL